MGPGHPTDWNPRSAGAGVRNKTAKPMRSEATPQILIGITTYLKPACSGTVIRALELLSCS